MPQDNLVTLGEKRFPGLAGSGGGGDSGRTIDMEPRVAVLEAHVGHIKEDLSSIKVASERTRSELTEARIQLGKLEQRVSHLPGKGFIVMSRYRGAWTFGSFGNFPTTNSKGARAPLTFVGAPPIKKREKRARLRPGYKLESNGRR